jgi:hypothetical protein
LHAFYQIGFAFELAAGFVAMYDPIRAGFPQPQLLAMSSNYTKRIIPPPMCATTRRSQIATRRN